MTPEMFRKYMREFAEAWPERVFVQQLAARIQLLYNTLKLNILHRQSIRAWYMVRNYLYINIGVDK
jgi:hypothetical protein